MRAFESPAVESPAAAHPGPRCRPALAARARVLGLLLLGVALVAAGCVAYDPDVDESALGGVGGSAEEEAGGTVEEGELFDLATGEAGGSPTGPEGSAEGAWFDPESAPPPMIHQGKPDVMEPHSGAARADPSPDPWR